MSQIETNSQQVHPAEPLDRSRVFWLLVVVVGLGAVAAAFFVPGVSDRYHDAEQGLHAWVASLFPDKLQPAILSGAHIFLTPWLYLVMMIAWFAERLFPARPNQPFFSVGMVQDFFGWFLINSVLRIVLIGLFIKAMQYALSNFLPFLMLIEQGTWHPVVAVVAGLVLVDFLNWFHHYLRHKVPFLWSFHAIHHSQKEMNVFTDLRVHLFEYIIAKPIVLIPLFMLGLTPLEVIWVVVILEAQSRIYHANIRSSFGPLRYVFVTPQSHRIHHSADPRHRDLNFGVIFCIWDKLFGTHWHDHTEYPETGVYDTAFPCEESVTGLRVITNYLRQFVYPFRVTWHAIHGHGWKLDSDLKQMPVTPPGDEATSDATATATPPNSPV